MPLSIVIVGGGIAGLSAAGYLRVNHNVTVLEKGNLEFDANDYGLSVVSNAFNLLLKAGIDTAALNMVVMTHLWQRDSQNKEIVTVDFDTRKTPGLQAPSILARRALVQAELLRFATDDKFAGEPARIVRNATVQNVNADTGTITTTDGQQFEADLIIGADGINSIVRANIVSPTSDSTTTTPTTKPYAGRNNDLVAFMTQIPISTLKDTPNSYLSNPEEAGGLVNWMSPEGPSSKTRLLAYHISPTELQVVGYAPEREFSQIFDQNHTSILHNIPAERVHEEFRNQFASSIYNLFSNSHAIDVWRIRDAEPLATWKRNKTILIGDAAHAVTPHAGQGCNISIEDAEALGFLLRNMTEAQHLDEALDKFVQLRRGRTQRIARFSRHMGALMSDEEIKLHPLQTLDQHRQETYSYQGAEHALMA